MISFTLNTSVTNIRNKFQKVQKWNCHDLCFQLTYGQRHSRNMAAQRTECVRVTAALTDTCWSDWGSMCY